MDLLSYISVEPDDQTYPLYSVNLGQFLHEAKQQRPIGGENIASCHPFDPVRRYIDLPGMAFQQHIRNQGSGFALIDQIASGIL